MMLEFIIKQLFSGICLPTFHEPSDSAPHLRTSLASATFATSSDPNLWSLASLDDKCTPRFRGVCQAGWCDDGIVMHAY